MTDERHSLTDGHAMPSSWRQVLIASVFAFVTAAAGAFASLCSAWIGGIVTHADLDHAVTQHDEQTKAMASRVVVLEAASADQVKRLKPLEDGDLERRRAREMLVTEIRRRLSLQAKLQVAMDPHRKDAADRAAAYVCAKFDDYILRQEDPHTAADKALEAALLQH